MESNAVVTTNGAGPHNLQLFVLSEDGTVLHCLPGYWNPDDLSSELELARKLNDIWLNNSISSEQKAAIFKKMQLEHLASHSKETSDRSHLQGFDAQYVAMHAAQLPELIEKPEMIKEFQAHAQTKPKGKEAEGMHVPCEAFKTTDKIMHERLSKTPFIAYDKFDIAAFTNYGINYYDKNENESEGVVFRPELKKLDLHKVTHDASSAPNNATLSAPTGAGNASRIGAHQAMGTRPIDQLRVFSSFTSARDYDGAFAFATSLIKAKPSNALGYEMRAISAYALTRYEQAYSDATRAAWLGCNDSSNAELRKLAKQRLGQKPHRSVHIAQK